MTDDRFIELLNLYIDQQISPAEIIELEAELSAHPARQSVYRQYCQIHRATILVGEQFQRDQSDATVAARIRQLRQQTSSAPMRSTWGYYAGGLAAACVAVFFIRFDATKPAPIGESATPVVAMAPAISQQQVEVAAIAPIAPVEPRPAYVSLKTLPVGEAQDYAAILSALRKEERVVYGNTSDDSSRQHSLFQDGVFESPRYWQENRTRDFRSRNGGAQVEFTGFQFQR